MGAQTAPDSICLALFTSPGQISLCAASVLSDLPEARDSVSVARDEFYEPGSLADWVAEKAVVPGLESGSVPDWSRRNGQGIRDRQTAVLGKQIGVEANFGAEAPC